MCETLSMGDRAVLLLQAGFPRSTNALAIAVAMSQCESGGYTCATNPNCPTATCYGLYQMNEGYGPALYDPQTASEHMVATYQASGWQYWGCGPKHQSGYLPFYPAGLVAARAALGGKLAGITGTNNSYPCPGGEPKRCPKGYGARTLQGACFCYKTGSGLPNPISGITSALSASEGFLHDLPAYLKIAGGGLVMVAGLAVLIVGATGGAAPAAAAAVATKLPPVRRAVGRRQAVRGARRSAETRTATEEARVRVRTVNGKVKVARRRPAMRESAGDQQAVDEDRAEKRNLRVAALRERRARTGTRTRLDSKERVRA